MGEAVVGSPEMDETRYSLREFCDTDYAALARIQNEVNPENPLSAETLRHAIETFRTSSETYDLVIEDNQSTEVVAAGALYRMPFEDDPAKRWIACQVLPSHQRQGIGSRLYDALVSEGRRRGATGLRCAVLESSKTGRAFAAKRAFVERRRTWRSTLDVASADTSGLGSLMQTVSGGGIEFSSLSREGADDLDVLHRIWSLMVEADRDEPHFGAYTPIPFDQFRRFFLQGENALPEAWFLARDQDRYVGMSFAIREPAQPEVLHQSFTGTRAEYRRRKIALVLKLMLIDFAKRSGFARIETANDSLNAAMWNLNRALGFRKFGEEIQLESELADPSVRSAPSEDSPVPRLKKDPLERSE